MILEPMWTLIFSMLWFAETMSAVKVAGCVLILFSILINRSGDKMMAFLQSGKNAIRVKLFR